MKETDTVITKKCERINTKLCLLSGEILGFFVQVATRTPPLA